MGSSYTWCNSIKVTHFYSNWFSKYLSAKKKTSLCILLLNTYLINTFLLSLSLLITLTNYYFLLGERKHANNKYGKTVSVCIAPIYHHLLSQLVTHFLILIIRNKIFIFSKLFCFLALCSPTTNLGIWLK